MSGGYVLPFGSVHHPISLSETRSRWHYWPRDASGWVQLQLWHVVVVAILTRGEAIKVPLPLPLPARARNRFTRSAPSDGTRDNSMGTELDQCITDR